MAIAPVPGPTLPTSTAIHPLFHFQWCPVIPVTSYLVCLPPTSHAPLIQPVPDTSLTLATPSLAPCHLQREGDSFTESYCLVCLISAPLPTAHLELKSRWTTCSSWNYLELCTFSKVWPLGPALLLAKDSSFPWHVKKTYLSTRFLLTWDLPLKLSLMLPNPSIRSKLPSKSPHLGTLCRKYIQVRRTWFEISFHHLLAL